MENLKPALGRKAVPRLNILRAESGVVAIEFALVVPFLIALWFGGIELTQALGAQRRVVQLTFATGDLVASYKTHTEAAINGILDAREGIMKPFAFQDAGIVVSAVNIDANGKANVAWSRGRAATPYAAGIEITNSIPLALRRPDTQLIVSEVGFTHRLTLGVAFNQSFNISDRKFFAPRLSTRVRICDANNENCV